MRFDVSTLQRVAKEIEQSGRRMQEIVNSPLELAAEIQKIRSSLASIQFMAHDNQAAGANADTAQYAPNQNQS